MSRDLTTADEWERAALRRAADYLETVPEPRPTFSLAETRAAALVSLCIGAISGLVVGAFTVGMVWWLT